jgi:hypothetical protein
MLEIENTNPEGISGAGRVMRRCSSVVRAPGIVC